MKRHATKQFLSMLLVLSFCISATASNKLLETIPDDAFLSILIERPQRALPPTLVEPTLKAIFESDDAKQKLSELIKRIPGPILFGWITQHKPQDEPSMFAVCEMNGPPIDVDALMTDTILPAIAAAAEHPNASEFKLEPGKPASRVINKRTGKPLFGYAVKDKLIFISADPMTAKRWAQGEWPKQQWLKTPGIKRMLTRLPKEFNARLFFNHMPLVRLAGKPKPNSPEAWMRKFWRPTDFIGSTMDLTWDKNSLHATASMMISEEAEGLAQMLVQPATSSQALGVFPDEFVAVGRLGWTSADSIAQWLYKLTDQFDETISAEYRQELAEFKNETGVDWNGGILGNMIGELAFGVRVDFTKRNPIAWAVVCPLANAASFSSNLDKLIAYYELPLQTSHEDELAIRTAKTTSQFSFAVSNGRFILADAPGTIMEIVSSPPEKDTALPRNESMRRCQEQLGNTTHFAMLIDVGLLARKAPMLPMLAKELGSLVRDGTIGLSVRSEEQLASVDLHWNLRNARSQTDITSAFVPSGDEALVLLGRSLGASIKQARKQARRVARMANMRDIGHAIFGYSNAHEGAFPDSLETLLREKSDSVSLEMFVSPYDGTGPTSIRDLEQKSYLVYRPGLTISSDPTQIIMAERQGDGGGACFLFVDGHVEYIREPKASELIAALEAGEPPVIGDEGTQ